MSDDEADLPPDPEEDDPAFKHLLAAKRLWTGAREEGGLKPENAVGALIDALGVMTSAWQDVFKQGELEPSDRFMVIAIAEVLQAFALSKSVGEVKEIGGMQGPVIIPISDERKDELRELADTDPIEFLKKLFEGVGEEEPGSDEPVAEGD